MQPTIIVFALDDDKDDIELLKDAFKKRGIVDYEFFSNPKQFLAVLSKDVHVAVVDYYLGTTTGQDVLREIRRVNRKCLITMISGDLNKTTLIKLYNSGANKYVEKETGWETEVAEYVSEHIEEVKERLIEDHEKEQRKQQARKDVKDIFKNA